MSDPSQRKEVDAFFHFFATFDLSRPVTTIEDLSDGTVLFEVLSLVCAHSSSVSVSEPSNLPPVMPSTSDLPKDPQHNLLTTGFYDSER